MIHNQIHTDIQGGIVSGMLLVSIGICIIACCFKKGKTTDGKINRNWNRIGRETRVKTLSVIKDDVKDEKPVNVQNTETETNTDIMKGEIKKQDWDVGHVTNKGQHEKENVDNDNELFQEYHEDANSTLETNVAEGESKTTRMMKRLSI